MSILRSHWRIQGGVPGTRSSPRVQILSFSYSFWQKFANNRLAHPIWELASRPKENPGSATGSNKPFEEHVAVNLIS